MKASDFFKKLYTAQVSFVFSNQAHFITMLFIAGGSDFFSLNREKTYPPGAYQYQIFNGRKNLSKKIKRSFSIKLGYESLLNFLSEKIIPLSAIEIAANFSIPDAPNVDTERLSIALSEQFFAFMNTVDNEVPDSVAKRYLELISNIDIPRNAKNHSESADSVLPMPISINTTNSPWRYRILLFDDVSEQREMLETALLALYNKEQRYQISIFSTNSSRNVIDQNADWTYDVYVLDLATKADNDTTTTISAYYGASLYQDLIKNKPNVLVKSKFFIYSKLPIEISREAFPGANTNYYQKLYTSPAELSKEIKQYLDELFIDELIKSKQHEVLSRQ